MLQAAYTLKAKPKGQATASEPIIEGLDFWNPRQRILTQS